MTDTINWNVKPSVIEKYLQVCKEAAVDDKVFATFKSNPDYTKILEHQSREVGQNYLNNLPDSFILMNKKRATDNDSIGTPLKEKFTHRLINDFYCSATSLQYLYVYWQLFYFYTSHRVAAEIVEIGGGYGGQCKIIQDFFDVKEYHIIDLPEVTLLQEKYLSHFKCNFKTFTSDNYPKRKYDLVISNYALSEITEPLQTQYIKDILVKATHGYITCNAELNSMDLLKDKNITILPDIEGERRENFIITW